MSQYINPSKLPALISVMCFCYIVMPLASPIMVWVWVLFICAVSIAGARAFYFIPALKNKTLNIFAIFCLALLVLFSDDYGLLSTMVNLLVVACCLKFMMLHKKSDLHTILVVQLFLIACGFIYHQGVGFAIYYAIAIVNLMYVAFLLNAGKLITRHSFLQTNKLLLQTLPIALALFLIVPRLPPFWQTPTERTTQTGLSESVTPGDIANLAQSANLVFRAEFSDAIPAPSERYWRSIVLDYFDGATWSIAAESVGNQMSSNLPYQGESFLYLIMAEPTHTKWLFSLDVPQVINVMSAQDIYVNQNYQLHTQQASVQPSLYILAAYPSMKLNHFKNTLNFEKYLQTPSETNPRTIEWVNTLNLSNKNTLEIIQALNAKFTEEAFSYTLKPPLMQQASVDQFLFDYQRGFCSHYASALTFMLRVAGVPARIVTGYQGGQLQGENIITVRQYDAHAWVEAWDDNAGWIRIDPTALVAPNRLLSGLLSSLEEDESELVEGSDLFRNMASLWGFKQLNDLLTVANHNWSQFVLDFDQDSQRNILEWLFGKASAKNLITFLIASFAAIAIFICILFVPWKRWLRASHISPDLVLVEALENKGHKKEIHETLKQFTQRISPSFDKAQRDALHNFVEHFYDYQYSDDKGNNKQIEQSLMTCLNNLKSK
ncbi:transglutaminase family protein [Agaribacter flavus]|uniref:TransglutaminaseTgpA domain-containing protein n=1 Tax=Agaribacter flavus TaxID=1902781 RepID=A0ABV7FPQ9_9ALTE